ncbi:MAG TPA: hypothetical protein VIA64_13585 [Burkholderiales bacterium]
MRTSIVALSLALLGAGPVFAAEEGAPAPAASQPSGAPAPAASPTNGGAATGAAPTGTATGTTAGAVGFVGLVAAGLFVAADDDNGATQHHAPTHH